MDKSKQSAVIVIFCDEGKEILLLKRAPSSAGQGWCLPGGKLDEDERPGHGVIRELVEETGIYLQNIPMYCGQLESEHGYTVHIFAVWMRYRQAVKLSDEHTDIAWVKQFEGRELYDITEQAVQLAMYTMFAMYSGAYAGSNFFEEVL